MACLTVGVAPVHGEPNVIISIHSELAVTGKCARRCPRGGRREERITALGTEEVLLVICAFSELLVFQSDVVGVGDSGLAVVTTRGKVLYQATRSL